MKIDDKKVEELFPFQGLSNKELRNLVCDAYYKKQFIKKDDIIYHRKDNAINYIVNELLGELVSEYFNLDTVKGIIYKYSNGYTLLTELFTDSKCKYSYINELFVGYRRNWEYSFDVLNNLDRIRVNKKEIIVDRESLKKLLKDLKTMIVRDYITNTKDRHTGNFMFSYDNDVVKLMPLYDYEYSFIDGGYGDTNVFRIDFSNDDIVNMLRSDDKFQEVLEHAMRLDMKKIIQELEEKYPISLNRIDKRDYEDIVKLKQCQLKEYKIIR